MVRLRGAGCLATELIPGMNSEFECGATVVA
jgi:hypothetical protein